MTISDKEELKNQIYKLKRHNLPNPFIMHDQKETIGLNSVINLVERLEVLEITEEQFLEYAKENNWIVGTPEQMFRFQKSIEELNEQKEPETVASVMADFYESLERMREVLAIEVEELEE